MVRLAKTIGASSVWVVDHLTGFFPAAVWNPDFTWLARRGPVPDAYFDWQVLTGHLAGRIGNLQLGVGVTEAIRRHPVVLAQAALSLSHLTRRPPILGMGSGEAENILPYGLSFDRPVSRLEEALEVVRLCLDGTGPRSYDGATFRLEDARFELTAGRAGRPQIWLGAHGPRMLELTGRFADGWLPAVPLSPEGYAESLHVIRRAAADSSRPVDAVLPAMTIPYVVGRDAADVGRQLRHPAVRFLALLAPDRTWQEAGLTHPLGAGFGGMADFVPSRYTRAEIEDAIDAVPPELLASRLVVGTPSEVVDRVGALAEAGLRHAVMSPVSPLVSPRALAYTFRTLPGMVRRLRSGDG